MATRKQIVEAIALDLQGSGFNITVAKVEEIIAARKAGKALTDFGSPGLLVEAAIERIEQAGIKL